VFYNIPPPDAEQLKKIVERRLTLNKDFVPFVDRLISHFEEIRQLATLGCFVPR